MSIQQAGIYSVVLYENKGFTFDYDSNNDIILSSIANTGETIELNTNDNFVKYSNSIQPAENNTTINSHLLEFVINALTTDNLQILELLQSSIYGWIPVITFMNADLKLINCPFFQTVDKLVSNVTHTFKIELKPRIFTFKNLKNIIS